MDDYKNRHGITLDEFFDDLSHANILYKLINTSNRYRSRFAEELDY